MVSAPDRLNSWKEIAHYLARDVRTTMRWERERGLPVHRVPGGRSRTVFAYAKELDRWLAAGGAEQPGTPKPQQQVQRPVPSRRTAVAVSSIVILVAAAAAIGVAVWARPVTIDVVRFEGTSVVAFSGDRSLWRLPTPGLSAGTTLGSVVPRTERLDLDGDTAGDAVIAYNWNREHPDDGGGVLAALGASGAVLWTQTLADRYTYGGQEYGPPWNAVSTAVVQVDGAPLVALASHHYTWWPSVLSMFDARGGRRGTFVNAGWIDRIAVSGDERHLLAAGVNNAMASTVLAVLGARRVDGTSPPAWNGTSVPCDNCPSGSPQLYFAMPWSELSSAAAMSRGATTVQRLPSGDIQLRAIELTPSDQLPELILELTPSFELRKASANDAFWVWHDRLEREGRITHAASACPFRRPTVRVWSPDAGWRVLHGG